MQLKVEDESKGQLKFEDESKEAFIRKCLWV